MRAAAQPLMADVFSGVLPLVCTAGFGSLYLQVTMPAYYAFGFTNIWLRNIYFD
jgi:hypothetical protein